MQACADQFATFSIQPGASPVRCRSAKRIRRARTMRVLAAMVVALAVLVFAPQAVHTMARTSIPPLQVHTVAEGDTLWEIAARHSGNQDVREVIASIKRVNSLKNATLQPGQQLLIPEPANR